MSQRLSSFLGGCAVLAAGLSFSGPVAAQAAQDTLRIRFSADIRGTDPGVNRDENTDIVQAHVLEGLVAFREDTTVGPLLAQSVTTSSDGRVYTFKLRPGLKFSNGSPVTADDVVFSWNRYMKPETAWRCLTEYDGRGAMKVLNVVAKDPSTIEYTLEKPSNLFLVTLARTDCGGTGIYHRSSLGPDGKWKEPIGTGPFKLGDWKRGQYIELLRNDAYAALPGKRDGVTGNKAPLVSKVRFAIIPDPAAAKAALLSGGVDIVFDITDEDGPEYKARKDLVMNGAPTLGLNGFLMQTRDPLLKDVRVRRAIALALDLPQLVEATTHGTAQASRSAIPRPSPFYGTAQAVLPKRDLAEAKKLLAEAGYKGQPIKITTNKRYENHFKVAVLAQAMAAEAGINFEIEVLEWATHQDRYQRGEYQILSTSFSSRLDPSLSYEMFTGPKATQARKAWDNPEAIQLVTESMQVSDKAQRQAIFDKLDGMLRADAPTVFLYSEVRTAASRANVQGYASWPLGQPRAWGVSFTGGR